MTTKAEDVRKMAKRIDQLVYAITEGRFSEFSMRVPAEQDRDADLVLSNAASDLREYADLIDQQEKGSFSGFQSIGWVKPVLADSTGPEGFNSGEVVDILLDASLSHHPEGSGWVQAFVRGPEVDGIESDAARMDRLQELVDLEGELLLHNGKGSGSGFLGFGLKHLGRTLREAVDSDLSAMHSDKAEPT
jgi:hypothetical protein